MSYCRKAGKVLTPIYSMLQIMKQDLEVVRFTHPFEFETFNIREPPKDVPVETANQIAEQYKNDIVSFWSFR